MRPKSFWWGVGVVGAAFLWRKQLRPLAVKGAKSGLLIADGLKGNFQSVRDIFFDLKQDAQMQRVKKEMRSKAFNQREPEGAGD